MILFMTTWKEKIKDLINLKQIDRDECIELFEEYKKQNKTIY